MNTVSKIDGFGTRRSGTSEVGNFDGRKRIISGYVYVDDGGASTTFKKGDVLAMEINTGGGYEITVDGSATSAATYFGYGNMFLLANSGTATHNATIAGVMVSEAVTVGVGSWARVDIQVGGILEVADGGVGCLTSVALGDRLIASATAGAAADEDTDVGSIGAVQDNSIFAIALTADDTDTNNGTDTTAGQSCSAYLLNPLNL